MMFPIVEAGPALEAASLPAFVVARDGLYLRKRSLLGLSQTKVGRVAHLPDGKEFVDYALPKVPADLMARAVRPWPAARPSAPERPAIQFRAPKASARCRAPARAPTLPVVRAKPACRRKPAPAPASRPAGTS